MKIIFNFVFITLFVFSVSAQTKEARKIDEFPYLPCGHLLARADYIASVELQKEPDAKIYFIYYEGQQEDVNAYNKTTKSYENKHMNPIRGNALNRTKELTLYLTKWRKISKKKLVLFNGGYSENYEVEIWIVPKNAEPPKPTPTVEEKDMKFRKGKPYRTRDCEGYYRSI